MIPVGEYMEYRRVHPRDWCSPITVADFKRMTSFNRLDPVRLKIFTGRGSARKSYEMTKRLGWSDHCNVKLGFREYAVYRTPEYAPTYAPSRKSRRLRVRVRAA